jgi:hypothetical protein
MYPAGSQTQCQTSDTKLVLTGSQTNRALHGDRLGSNHLSHGKVFQESIKIQLLNSQ